MERTRFAEALAELGDGVILPHNGDYDLKVVYRPFRSRIRTR